MPYTTAMKQLLGTDNLREIDIQSVDESQVNAVEAAATAVLREKFAVAGTEPPAKNVCQRSQPRRSRCRRGRAARWRTLKAAFLPGV